ncbi:PHP domain-containing protein [Oceaniserpentilla sp. 4NH20-0058]|uniref:PHP domain-containing protein n=1 Tax=Oceaniserpentilla sp. 4NH20-0058 TaxID=3127660 RepID=UPI003106A7E4
MLADLHCHSLKSDGQLTPSDLVDRAAEKGVTMLALTDHDTLNGIDEARQQAIKHQMEIISGIEFSSVWNGVGIHIVGLGFDESHPVMQAAVKRQEECRYERAVTIAQKLEKQGIEGIWEKAVEIANGAQIGRPHFAQALIEMEKVSNMAQAFKKYLGAGKAGDVKTLWPEMSEVVGWIRDSGGVAVIAHPDKYKMTVTKLKLLFKAFKDAGGNSIEVTTGGMDASFSKRMAQLCEEFDFMGSQGSDFHGPRPWSELGKFVPMAKTVKPVWSHWQ